MDTSNSERCGAAEVTTPIKHLPKNYVGELIANSRLNRELVSLTPSWSLWQACWPFLSWPS
jgi:NH3-dependent NAD+ synthetase